MGSTVRVDGNLTIDVPEGGVDASESMSSSSAASESSFADETTDGFMNDDSTHPGLGAQAEDEEKSMMHKKISNTFRWKLIVIALVFVNTTVVIAATSLFLRHEADKEYERAFQSAAETVRDAAHNHAKALTDGISVLGDAVTSYTMDAAARWPFITLPGFEERVAPIRRSSTFEILGFLPLVKTMEREEWEAYSGQEQGWIQESYETSILTASAEGDLLGGEQANNNQLTSSLLPAVSPELVDYSISPTIAISSAGEYVVHPGRGPYAPMWQLSPPPPPSETAVVNTDLMSVPAFRLLFGSFVLNQVNSSEFAVSQVMPLSIYSTNVSPLTIGSTQDYNSESARSVLFHPLYETYGHHGDIKGFAMGVFEWKEFFSDLLPDDVNGITCVLKNPCEQNQSHTFVIQGGTATYLGEGDLHDDGHTAKCLETVLTEFDAHTIAFDDQHDAEERTSTSCNYVLQIFASDEFRSQMETNGPLIFTAVIAAIFIGTGLIFLAYVYLVDNRQNKVMAIAMSTSAIVASLFPATVRDQIMKNAEEEVQLRISDRKESKKALRGGSIRSRRNSMRKIQKQRSRNTRTKSKPIADLFPETTVLFADIVGFTAWSSVREPTQVFELLETIYHNFDEIARRRRVFKVETIGDCYVAVTGLPDPCKDHAVTMCRFSRDCLQAMSILTKKLEVTLGPDTGELTMRFGMHSGAVTAGVLRGERSRFQLFGDTVNTAARMESNGAKEKIHISEQTAEHLANAGKQDWYTPREDKIVAKGKGELQTYWLHTKKSSVPLSDISSTDDSFDVGDWLNLPTKLFESQSNLGFSTNAIRECLSEQNQRLADWNSNQLLLLLDQVVAHRTATQIAVGLSSTSGNENGQEGPDFGSAHVGVGDDSSIIKEAKDAIAMPNYNAEVYMKVEQTPTFISEVVQQQLHDYVSIICSMYVDNPFHSYQHASHVTMSINKILASLAAPHHHNNFKPDANKEEDKRDKEEGARFHAKTFGISSDPITHFALAFAALIHDVDHPGVSNNVLVRENKRLARIFQGRCISEQNSFQCAWDLLMDPSFDHLRQVIYTTKEEFQHFRDLAINAVLATDLFDEDLNENRKKRWELAFPEDEAATEEAAPKASEKEQQDRRATVVLEYVVQASDVAHTMQHWHVYRKWNERLFHETLKSYKAGRLEEDPCDFWYEKELEFFDTYIIPMAKKLKGCGAFGVYFDEYLTYATENKREWERKGRDIVSEMEGKFESSHAMGDFSGRSEESSSSSNGGGNP